MYYPTSQITPNLFTNGGEFTIITDKSDYAGYYFKTSKGKYFTGRNQDDRPNIELIPSILQSAEKAELSIEQQSTPVDTTINYPTEFNVELYNNLKKVNTNDSVLTPTYNPVLPTQQNYQAGEFRRYFCKKTNEYQYIEINQDTFTKLAAKDPQILWQLYQPFFIDWQLTGDKQKVAQINRNSTELVVFRNKFFGLNEYLKFDYTKYYQQLGNSISGSYINGVNQGYVLDNRDRRSDRVFDSQNDSGSIRRDNSLPR
jgi:hypothetical protein